MAIADFLKSVGGGLAKAGRVTGAVLGDVGKAYVEANDPGPFEAKRKREQDSAAQHIDFLKRQLALSEKYGTLSPEQHTQIQKEIEALTKNPTGERSLIQDIHKAIHPHGATYQPAAPLPSAIPQGGEAEADAARQLKTKQAEKEQERQDQQKQTQDAWAFFSKFIPQEELPKAQSEWAMKNLGIAQTLKNIPGAAGQPRKGQDGKYYRPMHQADGSVVEEPMPPDWTPPAPKLVPKPGVSKSDGGNTYAVETPEGWKSTISGKILTDFRPMPNYAQVAPTIPGIRAQYEVTPVTNDQGVDVLQTRSHVAAAANSGNPMMAGAVGAPTGTEKTRQDFAESSKLQIQALRDVIKRNRGLFGPLGGREQDLAAWVGSSSPDAQIFRTAALILADHSAGVFGGRSINTIKDLQNTITSMHLTPDALLAGLDQDEKTFDQLASAGGRLPTPGVKPVGQLLPKVGAKPAGATMKVPGSDGKMHWSDGKNDLGVVQ